MKTQDVCASSHTYHVLYALDVPYSCTTLCVAGSIRVLLLHYRTPYVLRRTGVLHSWDLLLPLLLCGS